MIEKKNRIREYRWYRDEIKKRKEKPIHIITYTSIVNGFIKFIMRKVFEGFDVHLSSYFTLGVLGIRGRKVKAWVDEDGVIQGLAPAWGKTFQLWRDNPEAKANKQLVYCFNEHTNGVRYKFIWFQGKMKLTNKMFYTLALSRGNRREAMRHFIDGREYQIFEESGQKKRKFRHKY